MKSLVIIGEDRPEGWAHTRLACRAIVMRAGLLLLSYAARSGMWMIPGGGREGEESERDCCIREVAEETGFLIEPGDCVLETLEYYPDRKYTCHYYPASVVGETERKPTELERRIGMGPRWVTPEEALAAFARYADFTAEKDLMMRGLYLREYTALNEILR